MKILAFVYDFPHQKSVNGLLALATKGHKVVCIAAPKKELNLKHSKIRATPIIEPLHPCEVAKALNIPYLVSEHDNIEPIHWYSRWADVGVLLGARIIKKEIADNYPIINMHPGLLPVNRGLDNLKWAIVDEEPQGVTVHLIDRFIDRGQMLAREMIEVYSDDTLLDIFLRLQNKEINMLLDVLENFNGLERKPLGIGKYNPAMSMEEERRMLAKFDRYKDEYQGIKEKFEWRSYRSSF